MEREKDSFGAGKTGRRLRRSVRPYTHRVVRTHGGGLWTLEDTEGQLYLAVLSYENDQRRLALVERGRMEGRTYKPLGPPSVAVRKVW